MKENHTLLREDIANRRSKESRLKKNLKVAKRSLAFTTGTDERPTETCKELSEVSEISEVADGSFTLTTGTEEFSSETDKELSEVSPSMETSDSSITTFSPPVSSQSYSDHDTFTNYDYSVDMAVESFVFHEMDGSMEVDIVSNLVKEARKQVVNSSDVDKQSKKLVDELLKVFLDECYALPDEKDFFTEIVSRRGCILFLCILLCSFMLTVIVFYCLVSDRSHYGSLPT